MSREMVTVLLRRLAIKYVHKIVLVYSIGEMSRERNACDRWIKRIDRSGVMLGRLPLRE
jgi:hypothetical protein